jgi:CheY-like chemotaxis protein
MVAMPHKLLLADDSVTIQRVIELTFSDEDVQVIAVGNGQEAIDRVQRDHPDIVLADVGMPERNGYEVAAFIKGNPATAHIPVVLLTGAFEPIDEARARSVGCDGVLVKPFEPQIVISRVKDLLAGRQPSGMWGGAPVAQGPVRQAPPATFDARATAASGADPLEAYFDHLDAAFAASGPAGAADAGTAPPVQPTAARESIPMSRRPVQPPQSSTRTATDDPFANWDPDLMGDPARPAPAEPALSFPPRAATPPPPPAPLAPEPVVTPAQAAATPPSGAATSPSGAATPPPAARPVPTIPTSLVDAFAALLAAEQRIGLKPSAATMASPVTAPADEGTPVVTEELVEAVTQRVLARLTDQSRPTILDAAERLVREEIERIKQNS